MGHYFINASSNRILGVNHGGRIILLRSDLVGNVILAIENELGKISRSNYFRSQFSGYPSKYISKIEAVNANSSAFNEEKMVYEVFKNQVLKKYAEFSMMELNLDKGEKEDFIDSLLSIYLSDSAELTYEVLSGWNFRIASKPNIAARFFTSSKTGDTLAVINPNEIRNIEISPKGVNFIKSGGNVFINKERCYC